MYRKFREGKQEVAKVTEDTITRSLSNLVMLPSSSSITDMIQEAPSEISQEEECDNEDDDLDDDVDEEEVEEAMKCIEMCWKQIDKQCLDVMTKPDQKHTTSQTSGWQTVRVFVSSTFSDFFNEREILVKKVFPELREWCSERRLYLVDCDMRWGVPKDTTTADTIAACMEELDRCLEETNGKPFFLNMIGQRYGWIPAEEDIPDDIKQKYGWVPNTSITFMEMLHGALRSRNPNALFFLRSADILKDIPVSQINRYKDTETVSVKHLQMLKKKLHDWFPSQVRDYQCTVEGAVLTHGIEIMKIGALEEFGEQTIKFFKLAIDKMYPQRENVRSLSSLEEEQDLQKNMVEETVMSAFGRKEEADLLMSYINGQTDPLTEGATKDQCSRDARYWTSELTGNKLLCVYGPAGYGKTTLLATVAEEAAKAGVSVFYHFSGSTGSSHKATLLLQRLLVFLHPNISTETRESLADKSVEELRDVLKLYLLNRETTPPNEHIILIFDGLDQLSSNESVDHLCWLPPLFPNNMRCIVSCSSHPPTVSRVQEHPYFSLDLPPLSQEVAQHIAEASFAKYNKKLDSEQKSLILSSKCASCPLWLYLICEELRIYGHFRTLNKKMKAITESVEKLIQAILQRLIDEDETGCMQKAICLLACSSGVLTAADLQKMLGKIPQKEPASGLVLAKIRRNLKMYIRIASFNEQIVFKHNAMRTVAHNMLIKTREDRIKWHTVLADYLEFWSDNPYMKQNSLAFHLQQAGLKARLVHFIRKGTEAARIPTFQRSKYLLDCRCTRLADPVIHKTNPARICQFCMLSRAAFYPQPFHSNKEMCLVCGNRVIPNFPGTTDAHLCVFHSPMNARGPNHCFVCDKIMVENTGTIGKLCSHCGFGNYGKRCVALDIRW